MQNSSLRTAARVVTLFLAFSVVAALLVKVGGLSLQAMLGWQLLLAVVGGLSVLISNSGGGGGGRGRRVLAYAPVPVRATYRR